MIAVDQFIEMLRRSGLVEQHKFDETLAALDVESTPEQLNDIRYIARQFVNRYLLTVWQVRQLFKGRYKGFFLRQYKILGHLGTGGMSSVYLAEHILMKRRVAVKVLPRNRMKKSIYLERFIREAQAVASLDHPNIIRAYDIDQQDDVHYIVMEYFPGINLQELVEKEGKIPFSRVVNILRQIAGALGSAHETGIIHRDVKPGNILVNDLGEAKILDLGLALIDEKMFEGRITHIQENTILGTADYLAPEQALDSHKVDARADIYALGGVLYFCLTGHAPFPDGSVSTRLLAHQQKEPPSVLLDRPDTPPDLVALCQKMMSKKPEKRQQSALEVAGDFENWLIKHGYAEPAEFSSPLVPDAAIKNILTASSAVQTVQRGKLMRILHLMDMQDAAKSNAPTGNESDFSILGEERQVNLLDSVAGSGMHSSGHGVEFNSSGEPAPDEFDDPILHALNEIEMERARTKPPLKKTLPSGNPPVNIPVKPAVILEVSPQKTDIQNTTVQKDMPEKDWYRLIPVWFWTLFISGYIIAVFLAGILSTLLVQLLSSSGK
ncbi:MAG: serine/threonine protein kinase [Planctomycetaceae bacterium]|nr:serine/threonine protein kinase [Planctomycetaceae bacterium]